MRVTGGVAGGRSQGDRRNTFAGCQLRRQRRKPVACGDRTAGPPHSVRCGKPTAAFSIDILCPTAPTQCAGRAWAPARRALSATPVAVASGSPRRRNIWIAFWRSIYKAQAKRGSDVSRLKLALDQIVLTRAYTNKLLETVDWSEWFRQPAQGVTHIAWQVGHLAMAEYRLLLERIRGKRPEDGRLISDDFLRRFGRESVPEPDPAKNPTALEIRAVFDRVHELGLRELSTLPDAALDQPTVSPHPLFQTKLGALFWRAEHEMLHAGQIGLLKRLLGHAATW